MKPTTIVRKMIRSRDEEAHQKAIVDLLAKYERQGFLRYAHIPNQLPRPKMLTQLVGKEMVDKIYSILGGTLNRMGRKKGFPDLVVLLPAITGSVVQRRDVTIFIEVKSKKGRLSAFQKEWGDWLLDSGFVWAVAHDVNDVHDLIFPYIAERKKLMRRSA